MKKKILMTIVALCFVALLCASLVACNPDEGASGNNGPKDFETGTYSVTFKTDSEMELSNPVIKDVPYGTKVSAPKDSNGNEIKPVKRGYTFVCWSKDGKNPFDFDTTVITANTTLTAVYTPNVYLHKPVLRAKIEILEDGSFKVNETARPENEIGLSASELNPETTKLLSTYGATSELPCPTSSNGSKFCFWYYIDDEGKPVQFTRWKTDSDATVALLSKYNFTKELTIYPMFDDNLPKVTVKYADSITGASYDQFTQEYLFGQNIPESEMPSPIELQHGSYSFDYWYYVYVTVDKDGKKNEVKERFIYEADGVKEVTSPMDAAQAENNFAPVTLTLYAKWTKEIEIKSVADFKSLYETLRKENNTEAEKLEIERILTANITMSADLNFGDMKLEPLFDSEHVFLGTIDGGTYNTNNVVTHRTTIRGGQFGNKNEASVFGYNEGVIKNLVFNDVKLRIAADDDNKYADSVSMGVITTVNTGTVNNCAVVLTDMRIENLHRVVFGGLTAMNRLTTGTVGSLSACTVTITGFSADCEALTFGGLVGDSNSSATISKCTVNVSVDSIVCKDDNIASNGRSFLIMGGLVGSNSSFISLSTVASFNVKAVESLSEFVFGGVAGINTGSIRTTKSDSVLCSAAAPAKVSGSRSQAVCIGGLAGKNEGFAVNSYCNAMLYAQISDAPQNGSIVSVGGIMGSNYSDKKDTSTSQTSGIGAINFCYSTGEIVVTVADGIKDVTVYAGGIAGRNTHSKHGSTFTATNITVTNKEGTNKLGYLFGAMENDSKVNAHCYYVKENVLTLNGEVYKRVQGEGDDFTENFPVTAIGTVKPIDDFKKPSILTTMEFSGTIWQVVEGELPTFLTDIYSQN